MATRMYVCESAEHPSSLLLGLNEQRLKGSLCDITIRVQGHLFKAHVNVLASAMGYFRDLFCKPNKEKHEGIIDIPMIVNSTGFAKILDFVYTSQLCLSQSTVMQVMCSACYLQIPYVVEKCQEFITTHGHVSNSALPSIGGPASQQQRHPASKQSPGATQQSASASLTLLSQLNKASDLSRARALEIAKLSPDEGRRVMELSAQQKLSPQGQEADEQQMPECELINTPPSPGGHSNGDDRIASGSPDTDDSGRQKDHGVNTKQIKTELYCINNEDYEINGARDIHDVTEGNEREQIDHNSLAAYFRENEHWLEPERNSATYYSIQQSQENGDRLQVNGNANETYPPSHMNMVAKKEKPKKEYRCEYCNKMFGRQQHLKRHILTHTGERPYPCQYCDKRFRRSEHLKHHLVSHENVTGFVSPPSKKRQRRDRDDAVALSKMMLDTYGQMNESERLAITAAPVVLPSMYTDVTDRNRQSPLESQKMQYTSAGVTQFTSSASGDSNDVHRQKESALLTALNLSRAPKDLSPSSTDITSANMDTDEKTADENATSSGQASPKSESNSVGGYDENPGIIGMEGSEVLTSDLKRLIAAFDE
uniref:ZF(BTB/POZ) zinc finger protein n=1 Tax=Phallusia mammillata TaxID=59560 RepID=A0A6F9DWP0_9ASCI|nr:ZF(BTB/POZ) zinc finger protein [Phallusia mammillata]